MQIWLHLHDWTSLFTNNTDLETWIYSIDMTPQCIYSMAHNYWLLTPFTNQPILLTHIHAELSINTSIHPLIEITNTHHRSKLNVLLKKKSLSQYVSNLLLCPTVFESYHSIIYEASYEEKSNINMFCPSMERWDFSNGNGCLIIT